MGERYSRLFTLPENLYATGSPVVIAAGTLLKDNQTGNIVAQLKLRSISNKIIKAVRVKLDLYDTAGKALDETVEYDYLDLHAARDAEFGQKTPVRVANNKARSYTASVTEVVFIDQSVGCADGNTWEPLEKPVPLYFADTELLKQYQLRFGSTSKYKPKREKDLWYCTCGALNHTRENCHACGKDLTALLSLDMAELEAEKNTRLAAEARQAEEQAIRAAEEARKIAEEKMAIAAGIEVSNKKIAKILKITILIAVAAVILLKFIIVPTFNYNKAMDLVDAGNIIEAYDLLVSLDGYKDSAEVADSIYDQYKLEKVKTAKIGDRVIFGSYEQDNNIDNGKESIEWIVLDVNENGILLISKLGLDCKPYHEREIGITWENCSLRKWLNNDFINIAFSDEEKSYIQMTTIPAQKKLKYDTDPGNNTQDKVFVLSSIEAVDCFRSSSDQQCMPTAYAVANGAVNYEDGKCWWWLRSPSGVQEGAETFGSKNGHVVNAQTVTVRPAMWVKFDS